MTITTAYTAAGWRAMTAASLAFACAAAVLVSACASSAPEVGLTRPAYSCVDDSTDCIAKRQALLHQLQADNSRAWMREHPTPEAYATGVRLFAMKTKKREMNCDELERGRREAEGAQSSLRSTGGRLTPAQISRGAMFATEVGRELTNEIGRRCSKRA